MRYLLIASSLVMGAQAEGLKPAIVNAEKPAEKEAAVEAAKLGFMSPVDFAAVKDAKWLKGEPIKGFEPGKVYLFECWATWCGPCIAMIPHMNELYAKYHEKGLEIYGANVFEDDFAKVEEFVKVKGKMEYPVFFTGRKSAFAEKWLTPAGITAIPTAMVVKDGKFIFSVHPARLNDEIVEMLLSGDEGVVKAKNELERLEKAQDEIGPHLKVFTAAESRGDVAKMEAEVLEIKKIDEKAKMIGMMEMQIQIAKGEYEAAYDRAAKHFEKDPESKMIQVYVSKVLDERKPITVDKATLSKVKDLYVKSLEAEKRLRSPSPYVMVSMISYRLGQESEELKYAEKAVEYGKSIEFPAKSMEGFEKYLSEVKAGKHPTRQEFMTWTSIPATRMK